jgi:hypothetical protein
VAHYDIFNDGDADNNAVYNDNEDNNKAYSAPDWRGSWPPLVAVRKHSPARVSRRSGGSAALGGQMNHFEFEDEYDNAG